MIIYTIIVIIAWILVIVFALSTRKAYKVFDKSTKSLPLLEDNEKEEETIVESMSN